MIICHRINTMNAAIANVILDTQPHIDGIEFDIRDSAGEIIVQHDPFKAGQKFTEFVKYLPPDKFYIVNVKSEGIETAAIELLEAQGIHNFFLLDCSIPMMVKLGRAGEKRMAVRYSEFESVETVVAMSQFVSWIWIDVFRNLPITPSIVDMFKKCGLKTCLVSPELQGQPEKIIPYIEDLQSQGIQLDAVCTKTGNVTAWTASEVIPCPSVSM